MLTDYAWRVCPFETYYYYSTEDGRIKGMVHKLGTQSIIYVSKVYSDMNVEGVLGQYIDLEFGKKAIQEYWDRENRTYLT